MSQVHSLRLSPPTLRASVNRDFVKSKTPYHDLFSASPAPSVEEPLFLPAGTPEFVKQERAETPKLSFSDDDRSSTHSPFVIRSNNKPKWKASKNYLFTDSEDELVVASQYISRRRFSSILSVFAEADSLPTKRWIDWQVVKSPSLLNRQDKHGMTLLNAAAQGVDEAVKKHADANTLCSKLDIVLHLLNKEGIDIKKRDRKGYMFFEWLPAVRPETAPQYQAILDKLYILALNEPKILELPHAKSISESIRILMTGKDKSLQSHYNQFTILEGDYEQSKGVQAKRNSRKRKR